MPNQEGRTPKSSHFGVSRLAGNSLEVPGGTPNLINLITFLTIFGDTFFKCVLGRIFDGFLEAPTLKNDDFI